MSHLERTDAKKKKEYNQHSSGFKVFKNNDQKYNYVSNFDIFLDITDPLLNPLIFISYCYHERVNDNKEFNHGNSKPCCESQIMNH